MRGDGCLSPGSPGSDVLARRHCKHWSKNSSTANEPKQSCGDKSRWRAFADPRPQRPPPRPPPLGALSHVEFEVNHVAVADDVLLAFDGQLGVRAAGRFRAQANQVF